jgi:type VI secretion system protein ImpH
MASPIGPTAAALTDAGPGLDQELYREGYRFQFFQAVRLLERLHPARKPIGRHEHPDDEAVRCRTRVSLAFPPSEVYEVEHVEEPPPPDVDERTGTDDQDRRRDTIWVNFMGLTGVSGPLPVHLASELSDPSRARQTAGHRAFLDIFNHRLISLFYRAWEKYRFPIAYERGGRDTFSEYLYCLIGLGTGGVRGRLHIDEQILLYYAGLLAQRPRSAVALEGILEDYFGVRIEVVQFQGQWFELNTDLLTSLGADGQNHQLGVNAVLWERIWDPQARFRINVGPLTYAQFRDFLPGSDAYVHLVELARFFVGEDVNFEVRPMLKREEVPWCELGERSSVRLGWSMWLKERDLDEDVPQPVFGARLAAS